MKPKVKADVYTAIDTAVENGVLAGWRLAHKHTDTPHGDLVCQRIVEAVLAELCERLDWEGKA